MFIVHTYLLYLAISLTITVWVARTLHRNGQVFLNDAFGGNTELAASINHLLVVGFYLLNLGWIVVTLQTGRDIETARTLIELLSSKIGTVLLVLGVLHFANLYVFSRMRRRGLDRRPAAPPPLPPTGYVKARA